MKLPKIALVGAITTSIVIAFFFLFHNQSDLAVDDTLSLNNKEPIGSSSVDTKTAPPEKKPEAPASATNKAAPPALLPSKMEPASPLPMPAIVPQMPDTPPPMPMAPPEMPTTIQDMPELVRPMDGGMPYDAAANRSKK